MNARWLSLSLSARGLLRELEAIVDDDGVLETSLVEGADARAIGDELVRLLCAFSNERARIRRDVAVLLDQAFLVVEGARIRLVEIDLEPAPVSETLLADRSSLSQRGSAKRMRLLRARQREAKAASPVTPDDVTRDAPSDAGDASHVTRALSLDQKNLSLRKERESDGRDVSDARDAKRRLPRDAPFNDHARAIAAKVSVREPELTWLAFVARYAERKLDLDWDRLWEVYVVREKKFDGARPLSPQVASASRGAIDFDAPWFQAAEGS